MKAGDLIKWTFYADDEPKEYIGLYIKKLTEGWSNEGWNDILVLCGGKYQTWCSWQCEVINESG